MADIGPLVSPAGTAIIGTKELIPGCANISPPIRDHNGNVQFDYAGGTDVYWDDQRTVKREGQTVFICEDGDEWLESELVLQEDEDD